MRWIRRDASDAAASLKGGEKALGSARAIVSGAISASLETPEAAGRIQAALYESLSDARPTRPRVKRPTPRAVPIPRATSMGRPTGREVAEALILGEILLEPRSR